LGSGRFCFIIIGDSHVIGPKVRVTMGYKVARVLVCCSLLLSLGFLGCTEVTEPETVASDAPALPPAESMNLDLSFFEDQATLGTADERGSHINFLTAALTAETIRVGVAAALAPAHVAFSLAIHTVPSKDDDGAWLWIYTWRHEGQDNQIRLRGTPEMGHVTWELFVSFAGQEPELWFSGKSVIGSDAGFWVFRDFGREGDPEVLRIDWDMDGTDRHLHILNVDVGSQEEGDQIRYQMDGPQAVIVGVDASESVTWDIQWNQRHGAGTLRLPWFNEGNRACWDNHLHDTECPPEA